MWTSNTIHQGSATAGGEAICIRQSLLIMASEARASNHPLGLTIYNCMSLLRQKTKRGHTSTNTFPEICFFITVKFKDDIQRVITFFFSVYRTSVCVVARRRLSNSLDYGLCFQMRGLPHNILCSRCNDDASNAI